MGYKVLSVRAYARVRMRIMFTLRPQSLRAALVPPKVMSSSNADSVKCLKVTRIYSDEDGESHFGSFTINMTGSGPIQI